MKNYKSFILVLFVSMVLTSCTKGFEELNTNFGGKVTFDVDEYALEVNNSFAKGSIMGASFNDNISYVQFDMTLFKGTADKDIVMMTDYTNTAQNEFLGQLIDEYVKVSWGYSRCGYGCSDHASWSNAGFPASMPFESNKGDMNRHIHSAKDTLQNSGGNASHALKFAKLGLAYLVELAN